MAKTVCRALVVLLLLAGVCAPAGRGGDDPDKPSKTAELMRKKLKHSQGVLEGVALNDFDKIADNADQLITISQKAEWVVVKTPQYEVFSNQFRKDAESLVKNTKAKNLDGAALDYVALTMTCVKCHKYVRETRMTRLDGQQGVGLADFGPDRDGRRTEP
jgi:cytochrome c556